jgi:hypothetical protein
MSRHARAALVAAALAGGLAAAPSRAQGIRGEVTVRAGTLELRGLERDSLPEPAVPGGGLSRTLDDGTVVTCIPDEFCRWYPSGDVRDISVVTQDVSFAAWPGIEGVSGHVHVRGRYGTDGLWPRSDQELAVLHAYAAWDRDDLRVRAGRQVRSNGLGWFNFDGAAVLWRGFDPVRVEVYGGWSLAPNLAVPRTGSLLEDAVDFPPGERGLLVGIEASARAGRRAAGTLTYQREIREDRAGLYGERIAFDGRANQGRWTLDAALDYDLGWEEFNEILLRGTAALPRGVDLGLQARRYTPYFELWTIWGAFSPVGYDEARISAGWSIPETGVRLEAGGAWRDYEEADAGVRFAGLDEDGWRGTGRAPRGGRGGGLADVSYRADRGSGAARYGGDAAVGRNFGGGRYLALRGTSSQSFSEFRLGEQVTAGGGVDGAWTLGEWTVSGSVALYRLTFDDRPTVSDWTQRRAQLGISYRFGSEPVATPPRAPGAIE